MIKKRGILCAIILSMIISYLNPIVLSASETVEHNDVESSVEFDDEFYQVNEEPGLENEGYFPEGDKRDDLWEYKALQSVCIEKEVIHIPGEQTVTVTFENEDMIIEEATLHVESLLTGEEFSFEVDEIEDNVVKFVICYGGDAVEDKILLVSIQLEILGQEDTLLIEFATQEIEIGYVVIEDLDEEDVIGEKLNDIEIIGFAEAEVTELDTTIAANSLILEDNVILPSPQQVLIQAAVAPAQGPFVLTAINRGNQDTLFDLRLSNANLMDSLQMVHFAVWSERNGQNDLIWYAGTSNQGGDLWTATADVRRHRYTGRYNVHAWGTRADGSKVFMTATTFNVASATIGNLQILNSNSTAGTFDVLVSGIHSPSGVDRVYVAAWSRADQSDLNWYSATRQGSNFKATVSQANHNFNTGIYTIHAHVITGNGQRAIAGTTHNKPTRPQVAITATNRGGTETLFDLRLTNAGVVGNLNAVHFAVWSERNGQNDLIWYSATQSGGVWTATADVRRHRYTGRYHVHAWGTRPDGSKVLLANTTFNVSAPTIGNLQILNNNSSAGTFDVLVSGINSPSGVDRVYVAAWSRANQEDLAWYSATREGNNFRATVSLANHNFNTGVYTIHAHVITGNGQRVIRGITHNMPTRPQATVTATNRGGTETLFDLRLANAAVLGSFNAVHFAVWSERNGQNDLVWYNATQSGGVWSAAADVRLHRYTGRYQVHAWGTRVDGAKVLLGNTTFNVSTPTVSTIQIQNLNTNNGTFDVRIAGISSVSGVNNVYVPVWSRPDQSDIHWYNATRQGDGSFRATVNIENHNFNSGTYNVHAHVITGNGQRIIVGTSAQMNLRNFIVSEDIGGGQFRVSIVNPSVTNATSMYFPTWSERNGQNDLIWYLGTREGNRWSATIVARDHRYHGTFITHVHARTVSGGAKTFLGQTTFQVPESAMMTEAERRVQGHVDNIHGQVGRTLRASFDWTYRSITWSWLPIHVTPPAGFTRSQWYAVIGFEQRTGNCFVFAATFYQLAKGLGYNARYVEGSVGAAGGGFVPHGWVEININGNWYIFDPEAQRSLGGRGLNFFMQPINRPVLNYVR